MNRKDRRAHEAKTRQGDGPQAAQFNAKLWDKVYAAEAKTVADMLAAGGVSRDMVLAVLDNAHNFASGFNDEKKFYACSEGCHFCCHQRVGSTAIEIVYIATYLKEMRTEEDRARIVRKLEETIKARPTAEPTHHRCPFLSGMGNCTIYDVRPLACRSVTSDRSEPCREHLESGSEAPKVADQRRYIGHQATVHGLDLGVSARGLQGGFLDFHHALHTALSDPTALERWYAGEHVFGASSIPPKQRRLPLL